LVGSETAIPELLKALERSDDVRRYVDEDVLRDAAEALAKIGSETAIPGLLKALEDSNSYVRGNAAEALGKIGSETAIAGLLKALEHSHKYVRGNAAHSGVTQGFRRLS